ncbi:uncharacterized protein [Euwallacea fornicatus]|uniref:uncharacterized protein isoform X3 n=1 Tax=Euwallacea fornicatus TaxID=995702 RepID=UPI00338DC34C
MSKIDGFLIFGCVFCVVSYACANLTITQIIGPDSIEIGSKDDLILDCDFNATDEKEVVLKWFFNGLEDNIYQWIPPKEQAYSLGSLKDFIDPTYKTSMDPNQMFRALKFKEINHTLSGNYSCKVDTNDEVEWLTKQLIVYSPPTSFEIFLTNGNDQYPGDEMVFCQVFNVFPKPDLDFSLASENGTIELPENFELKKIEIPDQDGFYNVSITLTFNSSYLDSGTTKFICELSIDGTNYTDEKSVEHFVGNGDNYRGASILLSLLLILSLVLAT